MISTIIFFSLNPNGAVRCHTELFRQTSNSLQVVTNGCVVRSFDLGKKKSKEKRIGLFGLN